MVPAAVIIAFLLLGVEEIGVQIEEPFGILPLGVPLVCMYCTVIISCLLHCWHKVH